MTTIIKGCNGKIIIGRTTVTKEFTSAKKCSREYEALEKLRDYWGVAVPKVLGRTATKIVMERIDGLALDEYVDGCIQQGVKAPDALEDSLLMCHMILAEAKVDPQDDNLCNYIVTPDHRIVRIDFAEYKPRPYMPENSRLIRHIFRVFPKWSRFVLQRLEHSPLLQTPLYGMIQHAVQEK